MPSGLNWTTKNRNDICIEITMNNSRCDMNDNLLIRLIARPRIFFDDQIGIDIELLTRCRKFNRAIHIIIDFLPSIIYVSIKRALLRNYNEKNLRSDIYKFTKWRTFFVSSPDKILKRVKYPLISVMYKINPLFNFHSSSWPLKLVKMYAYILSRFRDIYSNEWYIFFFPNDGTRGELPFCLSLSSSFPLHFLFLDRK